MEDIDETALSYAEIKALCAGNPLIAEKMNLDIDVARLRMLKADHQSQVYRLEDDLLKAYPKLIAGATERIAGLESDMARYEKHNVGAVDVQTLDGSASVTARFVGMTIGNHTYSEKEPAAKALLEVCAAIQTTEYTKIGEYMGFEMSIAFDTLNKQFSLALKGELTHKIELGTDAFGNITRINNLLAGFTEKMAATQDDLVRIEGQMASAREELEKPFLLEHELNAKELKLSQINLEIDLGMTEEPIPNDDLAEPLLTADSPALRTKTNTDVPDIDFDDDGDIAV